ncbi:hypothetical protein TIFTF001_006497 [Ficus carica]|uniref:Uncharacterized protein n=1 Tax=Ficus carica TaxID=3494 RepID=A0AA88DFR0_FICCA|nr:hypothetical protein TIFTF001_006497 [Ficus carica]
MAISLRHVSTSTISGVNEVLRSSIILPAVLNADSEETVETGIVKMSRAKRESTEKFIDCNLYQSKMLKSSLLVVESSSEKSVTKYFLSSECVVLVVVELAESGRVTLELDEEPDLAGAEKKSKIFFFFRSPAVGRVSSVSVLTCCPNLF